MTDETCAFSVAGEPVVGHASGALYVPGHKTLVVSDLHFEKGSFFAAKGQFLPPYDTRTTLARLQSALQRFNPKRVIALGDSFHDGDAGTRIADEDWQVTQALSATYQWTWITGNHDEDLPAGIGGTIAEACTLGPLRFCHEPTLTPVMGEVAGHLHPCARVRTRQRSLRRRCFVGDGDRLIMPAYGAFTGGLDISDEAFHGLFARPVTAWVMGRARVYAIPAKGLAGVT